MSGGGHLSFFHVQSIQAITHSKGGGADGASTCGVTIGLTPNLNRNI